MMTPDQLAALDQIATDLETNTPAKITAKLRSGLQAEVFGPDKTDDTAIKDYLFSPAWAEVDDTPVGLAARIRYFLSVERPGAMPDDAAGFTKAEYAAEIKPYS